MHKKKQKAEIKVERNKKKTALYFITNYLSYLNYIV